MWTRIRVTGYVAAALVGSGLLLQQLGVANYNPVTGMLDFKPFNVMVLAGVVGPILFNVLAAVAARLGWGQKP